MSTAIVAFGGNALVTDAEHDSIPQQYETVSRTVPPLIDMVEQGWKLVVSHGNGPQVGFILRRSELAQDEVDPVPVDYAVADTQGAIGYMFVKALRNELARRGLSRPVVAVVTHSVVEPRRSRVREPDETGRVLPRRSQGQGDGGHAGLDHRRGRRARMASHGRFAATHRDSRDRPDPSPARRRGDRRRGGRRRHPGHGGIRRDRRRRGSRGGQGPCLRSARARPGRRPADDPHRCAAGGHRVRHARGEVAGLDHRRGGARLHRFRSVRQGLDGTQGRGGRRLRRHHAGGDRRHRRRRGDPGNPGRNIRNPDRRRTAWPPNPLRGKPIPVQCCWRSTAP